MEMTVLKNISKTFTNDAGTVKVLDNLDLSIEKGDFFSLLGPSGCGKTTIIRCIAGLETPDAGEIYIGGKLVFSAEKKINIPPYKRDIGMVFQSYAIWPHMTVGENIAFPLKHGGGKKMSPAAIKDAVEKALKLVKLDGYGDRPAPMLSGGQQQRVALARALAARPEVVLLDEPLSNLDAKLRQETRNELRQLFKEIGATAIFVTHDQAEAFAVSDKVAVMHSGRLQQLASPREIYLKPTSPFVADFVGRINFLDGVAAVEKGERGASTEIGFVRCAWPEGVSEGRAVKLGIRPERISSEPAKSAGVNRFAGVVRAAVFLGEYFDSVVEVAGHSFDVRLPPESQASPGDETTLSLPPEGWLVLAEKA